MSYTPPPQSAISTVNSTTSVLAGAAVFTGTSEDVTQYASATVLVIASHASATDGLSIQQSSDGTNWDNIDAYSIPAATAKSFGVQITGRFLRVVYTNGATLQTSFRLQTILHYYAGNTSSVRPQDARTNDNDMQESIAYLAGYNGTTWDRVRTKGTGVLSADVTTINNVAPLMGNGVTGTGSQRVTIASDNTAFPISQISTSVTPGNAATNLGKAEDAAHASGDTGVAAWGVRNDTLAAGVTSASGDYSQLSTDTSGILITAGAPRALKINPTTTTITSSTTETTILTAVAATFLDIHGLTLVNSSATATLVTLRDATAGTVRWTGIVPAGSMNGFMLPLDSAIPQATVNNNWTITCGTSVASLYVTAFAVKRV